MHFRTIFLSLLFIGLAISLGLTQSGSSSQQTADEVIAIVKAQWAADAQKNVAEGMKNIADDYTEFNSDFATRIEGKRMATRFSEAQTNGVGQNLAAEMLNPKVQMYGDVAILSYNYAGMAKDKDGTVKPSKAKSTRVYAKIGGKWMLVHANFGADPTQD
jgi:ketosteroid isomerase-like protein